MGRARTGVPSCRWGQEVVLLIMLLVCVLGCAAADATDTRPIVVFREDDIRASWRTPFLGLDGMSALEYGKLKRIPITWGVITDIAGPGWGLTWAELKDYIDAAGGELASHSCKHLEMASAEEYISELVNSKAIIEQNVPGYACTTFLQPGTWTGDALLDDPAKLDNPIGQAIRTNYSQSQAYLGRGWQVGSAHHRYGIEASWKLDYENPGIAAVLTCLDVIAASPGLICTISCHGVKETAGGDVSSVRADVMKATMDRLAELRDQGKIRLMTMHEAYHTALLDDLNRLVDPGFQLPIPPAPKTTWTVGGGAYVSDDGTGSQKYCVLPKGGSASQYDVIVPPGRYVLSWKQKVQAGQPVPSALRCYLENRLNRTTSRYAVYGPQIFSSVADVWEQKSVLLLIRDGLPTIDLFLACYSDSAFCIDDVSLVRTPVDPAVSASNCSVRPSPTACSLSWATPGDANTAYVDIRLGNRTHPARNTDQEGILFARLPAVPGATQEITRPINWSQQSPGVFFSVFAVRRDGTSADPDLACVEKDTTAPTPPVIDLDVIPDMPLSASWTSTDPESAIYQYRYAVGTSPGGSDIVGWQTSNVASTTLGSLPLGTPLHLSVQAQNAFGMWSEVSTATFQLTSSIASATRQADGTQVTVSGIVTAVFGDCCYVQQTGMPRGIRVVGCPGPGEGQTATVTGTITSVDGERAVIAQ